jgi:hypothetical protein
VQAAEESSKPKGSVSARGVSLSAPLEKEGIVTEKGSSPHADQGIALERSAEPHADGGFALEQSAAQAGLANGSQMGGMESQAAGDHGPTAHEPVEQVSAAFCV